MEEKIKFCDICGKQIENAHFSSTINGRDAVACVECGSEILFKKNIILELKNKQLSDRWDNLKEYIKECQAIYEKEKGWVLGTNVTMSLLDYMEELEKREVETKDEKDI